ncbi:carboxypeptidase regulatory-like domain-containing protein [Novisyntrophococcus fermenticellae]|uniref:carboxypeptidase regulatory-like domain-containing protein n=1 Tax=Novisyntrophococcus fermenticellae TaxID=2068655 RepID=UPI001E592458|nr:carboxypeptidase regulatory-like domain-containing protein [Novisyntrophococcus fermenticellae]
MNPKNRYVRWLSIALTIIMALSPMSLMVKAEGAQQETPIMGELFDSIASYHVQKTSAANTASTENQVRNGKMEETSNGMISYWEPIYGAGCNDDTITRNSGNSVKFGPDGKQTTIQLEGGSGNNYAVAKPDKSYTPYEASYLQMLVGIPDGTYTLSAKIATNMSDDGNIAKMFAYANDGEIASEVILENTFDSQMGTYPMVNVTIPEIEITNGRCRLGFYMKSMGSTAGTAGFLTMDDVNLSAPIGILTGKVTNQENQVVSEAAISVKQGDDIIASGTTDSKGVYNINTPPGENYIVEASHPEYTTVSVPETTVILNETTTRDLQFTTNRNITVYYVDSVSGNDNNTGASPQKAWRTINKINEQTFNPGDTILFKSGCSWAGTTLRPQGDGTSEAPITIGKYGGDTYPAIHANYVPGTPVDQMEENQKLYALELNGVEYYIVKDLELTSFGQHNSDNTLNSQGGRRGVYIKAKAGEGSITHSIMLDNLYIHDINGHNAKKGGSNGREGAGIHFENNGKHTYIDGLTIQNCTIEDVSRNGITSGGYDGGRAWGYWDWQQEAPTRHQNVIIRNNVLDHIAGDGIVPSGTYGAVIEHNIVKYAGCDARPVGSNTNLSAAVWPFDTDNSVFQFNEVAYTGTPKNTEISDGEAFDSDYYCINTVFQYNYSHDNDGGFLMICGPQYAYTDGTVVRYNISENDGSMNGKRTIFEIGGGGGVDHSYIYNNTIYTSEDHKVYSVVRGEPWDGKPKGTHFFNNIFCINSETAKFGFAGDPRDIGKEEVVTYSNNLYCGTLFENGGPKDRPEDAYAVFGDAKFVNPGEAGDGYANAVAYKIQEGSAAIGKGRVINQDELGQKLETVKVGAYPEYTKAKFFYVEDKERFGWKNPGGGRDFFGNSVPEEGFIDIGAHQYSDASDTELCIISNPKEFTGTVEDTAVFNVEAKGIGLNYEWQYCNANSNIWRTSSMAGNNTAEISVPITKLRDGQKYHCIVTDAAGNSLISEPAVLKVGHAAGAPVITLQPVSYSGAVGESAAFTVQATGTNLTYQWQYCNANSNIWRESSMEGSQTGTVNVPVWNFRDGQKYRCVVTSESGRITISDVVVVSVK